MFVLTGSGHSISQQHLTLRPGIHSSGQPIAPVPQQGAAPRVDEMWGTGKGSGQRTPLGQVPNHPILSPPPTHGLLPSCGQWTNDPAGVHIDGDGDVGSLEKQKRMTQTLSPWRHPVGSKSRRQISRNVGDTYYSQMWDRWVKSSYTRIMDWGGRMLVVPQLTLWEVSWGFRGLHLHGSIKTGEEVQTKDTEHLNEEIIHLQAGYQGKFRESPSPKDI